LTIHRSQQLSGSLNQCSIRFGGKVRLKIAIEPIHQWIIGSKPLDGLVIDGRIIDEWAKLAELAEGRWNPNQHHKQNSWSHCCTLRSKPGGFCSRNPILRPEDSHRFGPTKRIGSGSGTLLNYNVSPA
jgi:hypothetical protein